MQDWDFRALTQGWLGAFTGGVNRRLSAPAAAPAILSQVARAD